VREIIIGEKVKLVQKVSNIDTTKRIHLREWQHTWESVQMLVVWLGLGTENLHLLLSWLFWCIPTDVDDFVEFLKVLDWHRHVVVR
jgi:hypothetical protein